jgi:hypothetical protein
LEIGRKNELVNGVKGWGKWLASRRQEPAGCLMAMGTGSMLTVGAAGDVMVEVLPD